jgi:hypothetical protein
MEDSVVGRNDHGIAGSVRSGTVIDCRLRPDPSRVADRIVEVHPSGKVDGAAEKEQQDHTENGELHQALRFLTAVKPR